MRESTIRPRHSQVARQGGRRPPAGRQRGRSPPKGRSEALALMTADKGRSSPTDRQEGRSRGWVAPTVTKSDHERRLLRKEPVDWRRLMTTKGCGRPAPSPRWRCRCGGLARAKWCTDECPAATRAAPTDAASHQRGARPRRADEEAVARHRCESRPSGRDTRRWPDKEAVDHRRADKEAVARPRADKRP